MKVRFSREVVIGLSVLLLLTVILVIVAVRRFMRPGDTPPVAAEVAAAIEHERPAAPSRDEHRLKELETHKPPFVMPTAAPANAPALVKDEPGSWVGRAKEHRDDIAERAPQLGPAATDFPSASAVGNRPRHDENEHAPLALAAAPVDDRYGVPGLPASAAPSERTFAGAAKPTVIQVSDDAANAPLSLDHREPVRGNARPEAPATLRSKYEVPPGPLAVQPAGLSPDNRAPYSSVPPRRVDAVQPQSGRDPSYARRDPRDAYDPAASAVPADRGASGYVDRGPSGYPGPAAAYAQDNAPRQPEIQASYAQTPLRSDGMYEVQPNDSYWTISERVYGSGAYFRALAEANRGKAARPDRLPPGMLISTPPVAQLEKDYPDCCPRPNRRETVRTRAAGAASLTGFAGGGRSYVVQEGDTLSSIARNELGKVSRWAEIYQLNREALGKEFDYLTPGMRLVLPSRENAAPERTTRRSDEAPPFTR